MASFITYYIGQKKFQKEVLLGQKSVEEWLDTIREAAGFRPVQTVQVRQNGTEILGDRVAIRENDVFVVCFEGIRPRFGVGSLGPRPSAETGIIGFPRLDHVAEAIATDSADEEQSAEYFEGEFSRAFMRLRRWWDFAGEVLDNYYDDPDIDAEATMRNQLRARLKTVMPDEERRRDLFTRMSGFVLNGRSAPSWNDVYDRVEAITNVVEHFKEELKRRRKDIDDLRDSNQKLQAATEVLYEEEAKYRARIDKLELMRTKALSILESPPFDPVLESPE